MSNQFYHEQFIHNCISNSKRGIKNLMKNRPVDYRYYIKGMKVCIVMKHNHLLEWLYSKKGGIINMGKELIANLITFANHYENYNIALWLVNEYKEFEENYELKT